MEEGLKFIDIPVIFKEDSTTKRRYIADLPNEVLVEMIQKMDYPTLTKFCATSQDFQNFCEDPLIRNILIEKEYEYVENNLDYLMSQDKLDEPLADLLEFVKSNLDRGEYDASVAYDRFTRILDGIPKDYLILNRFTPFEKVVYYLDVIFDIDFKNKTKVPGCYVKPIFLPELSRELGLIVFIKKQSSECEQLYSMSVSSIKSLMDEEEKTLARKIAKRRGPRSRPNKADNISAILQTQEGVFRGEETTERADKVVYVDIKHPDGVKTRYNLHKLDKHKAYEILSGIPNNPGYKIIFGDNPEHSLLKYNMLQIAIPMALQVYEMRFEKELRRRSALSEEERRRESERVERQILLELARVKAVLRRSQGLDV